MPKTINDKSKKGSATSKTAVKPANADKPKREPTAYNLFCKKHLKDWIAANPGRATKEGMAHIAAMWKDAPENPNRGKASKAKRAPRPSKIAASSSDPPSSDD